MAAPLGGMTLAQLGADVIRFDQIGGGLDYHRWPLAADGQSLFLGRAEQGQALDSDRRAHARGARAGGRAGRRAGRAGGIFPDQFSRPRLARIRRAAQAPRRPGDGRAYRQSRRHQRGRLHGQPGDRLSVGDRAAQSRRAAEQHPARMGHRARHAGDGRTAGRRTPSPTDRRGAIGESLALGRGVRDGRESRAYRGGANSAAATSRRTATTCMARSATTSRRATGGA